MIASDRQVGHDGRSTAAPVAIKSSPMSCNRARRMTKPGCQFFHRSNPVIRRSDADRTNDSIIDQFSIDDTSDHCYFCDRS